MKVLIILHHRFELWNAPAWFAERLAQDFPQWEIRQFSDYEDAIPHLAECDIAITWSLRPEQFALARKLRWIHSPAAAVHQLMFPTLVASDVLVTNARSVHGPVVAEHVLALIFALAKKIPSAVRLQQRHVWGQESLWTSLPRPREVQDATLGLVGLGSIGSEVARRAYAVGMRVVAVREHREKVNPDVQKIYGPAQLPEMLLEADFVVIAAPLTNETRHLFDTSLLARMKPQAYLINVSRGALVDEIALTDALRDGHLGGAALDVFEREPLPADSPLWNLENLLITPHTAAVTEKLWERHYVLIRENLERFVKGEPLLGMVDKSTGY
jgi:phosphoglycerate dehydrogenase-like enzyme